MPDLFRAQQYFLGLVLIRASCPLLSIPSGLSLREAAGPCLGYQAFGCLVMASLHPSHFAKQSPGCVFIWGYLSLVFLSHIAALKENSSYLSGPGAVGPAVPQRDAQRIVRHSRICLPGWGQSQREGTPNIFLSPPFIHHPAALWQFTLPWRSRMRRCPPRLEQGDRGLQG